MAVPSQDIERLQSKMSAAVREHWKAFLFEGILLAILGLAAMILPPLASLAVTIFLGWMFLISGVGGLIVSFWARQMPGFWWSLISAALDFLAEGVVTIMYALEHRRERSQRWGWMLTAGLMDIIIAGVIIAGLPGSADWAIGLLVGINLMFGGITLIVMALAARNTR